MFERIWTFWVARVLVMIFSAESIGVDHYAVIDWLRVLVPAAEVLDGASIDPERCHAFMS
jgi:hypothetical protein